MTMLVTSVLCNNSTAAAEVVAEALAAGTDAVELRIDLWDDKPSVESLADLLPRRRWIAACRPTREGGHFKGDAMERLARLIAASRGCEGYIDFEFTDWQRRADIRQKLGLAVAHSAGGAPGKGRFRLILSAHDFEGRPKDPAALLAAMSAEVDVAAVKLAWRAEDICDNLIALELLRTARVPTIVICMGECGLLSRVLARKFGAFATYCAPAAGQETAPGQVTLAEMLGRYRWRSISRSTRVFGVIGAPVTHSTGATLFNACFDRHRIDAVYLPLLVEPSPEVLGAFLDGCQRRPWLDVGGFSVTLPHKAAVANWVGERIEPLAARIGAVNTLVADKDGFTGHNTDYAGALEALTGLPGCDRRGLGGLRVDVLGAGGVARAVVAGLCDCGCRVTIHNHRRARAEALAEQFGCACQAWERRGTDRSADLLINCTNVGMWPQVGATPVPAERLDPNTIVFDVVYNPVQTRLLGEAKRAGCRTIDGLSMFVAQAAAQFELWTGQGADRAFMRQTVEAELRRMTPP